MQRYALALLISLATATTAAAEPADDANAVIDDWSVRYSANDAAGLLDLYAADAILLGTTSPVISEGRDAIKEYFKDLPGSGRKNTIVERRTIVLDQNAVVGTGFYRFARAAENDAPRPARFTMVVVKREGRWMILHHHSSPLSAARQ